MRNLGIKTIDLASYHIYPNAGPYEMQITQSQVCSSREAALIYFAARIG